MVKNNFTLITFFICILNAVFFIPTLTLAHTAQSSTSTGNISYEEIQNACGVNAVYIILKLHKKNVKYNVLLQEMKYDEIKEKGANILNVSNILKKYGFNTSIVNISFGDMANTDNGLFILYMPPADNVKIGHFSIFRAIGNSNLEVVDPPFDPEIVNADTLSKELHTAIPIGQSIKLPFTKRIVLGSIISALGIIVLAIALLINKKSHHA